MFTWTFFLAVFVGLVYGSQLEDDIVKAHNEYRRKHGVPALTINKEISAHAQEWADHLASTGKFEHRVKRKYGENLFSSTAQDKRPGLYATQSWYDEIALYNFSSPGYSSETGHFTQVIWKNSKEVGAGIATGRDGRIYVVANYNPPGNVRDQFPENVPRPISKE